MRRVENVVHGIKCKGCGKTLLYGAIVYKDGTDIYCKKCGKEKV